MTIRAAVMSLALAAGLGGCATLPAAPPAGVREALAPSGALRVALYVGTPTSVLSEADRRGVGYDLGRELARRLHVPFAPMILAKNAEVQAAIKAGKADVAFTKASPERAREMDFTRPYLTLELGYLAGPKTRVAAIDQVDRPGVRVGVTAGSSSLGLLTRAFKAATVVPTVTLDAGVPMLEAGTLDVYATNKASLYQMSDKAAGAHVLAGAWGVERHAMAIPKGREAGLAYADAFIAEMISSGKVKAAEARAGLRGAVDAAPAAALKPAA